MKVRAKLDNLVRSSLKRKNKRMELSVKAVDLMPILKNRGCGRERCSAGGGLLSSANLVHRPCLVLNGVLFLEGDGRVLDSESFILKPVWVCKLAKFWDSGQPERRPSDLTAMRGHRWHWPFAYCVVSKRPAFDKRTKASFDLTFSTSAFLLLPGVGYFFCWVKFSLNTFRETWECKGIFKKVSKVRRPVMKHHILSYVS